MEICHLQYTSFNVNDAFCYYIIVLYFFSKEQKYQNTHIDLFHSCVGNKVNEQIANRLGSETKIAVFGPLFKVDLKNNPHMKKMH